MSSIKAIIFDIDGVLIPGDKWHQEAFILALSDFDISISKTRDRYYEDLQWGISFERFKAMVSYIRNLEKSLGENKVIYSREKQIRRWATRSLVALKDLKKGDKIKTNDVWSKRPGTGIPSRYMEKVIGLKVLKNIKKNTLIRKNQIQRFL